jgi:hypothetical protein
MSTPARLLAIVTSALAMLVVAPAAALADAPTTWETEEGLDWLGYSILLVGIPAALFVAIWLFSLATARRNYVPPAPGSEIHVATGDVQAH